MNLNLNSRFAKIINMTFEGLNAISPVDGRYFNATSDLKAYFSEAALIKYRIKVEVEYFISLCKLPLPGLENISLSNFKSLRNLVTNLSEEDAAAVKLIEQKTNHDVKAVEYFLKEKFDLLGLGKYKEFIHFGLTSQDINNTAIPLSIKDAINDFVIPEIHKILDILNGMVSLWQSVAMLARTHGQPASPTRLGKELDVFHERIFMQLDLLKTIPYSAKFGGATGNFNAHAITYPTIDWKKFANDFVEQTLGLHRSKTTTQIEHYDNFAALCDNFARINTILIDLCRDIWTYISMDYFKQKIKEGETGSSTMPHKVNPIDFENAEGNFGFANAIFQHLASKLPVSRLQRDLTDSTVLRNVGMPFAYSLIALKSLNKGLNKLILNENAINNDLENNWAVVGEAIQSILRREGVDNPYEKLKALTRTDLKITKESLHQFIESLDIEDLIKAELKNITPQTYTGI